ncbi:MAG: DUF3800 domain-containing protein [Candidatus Portnoybacteria bacterium]|nr:DUF3800 domain-containing protein [Candidatus Portnoybacteria bacterium]MDD4983053.1 DUF3800 domain-containing protein [Candidatus Portnoybacteria bacterium]
MGAFNFLRGKENNNLSLTDYRKIWTKFCFLDESGSLNNKKDPFFTVGFIKCSQPYYLNSKIIYERNKRHFYDEMKFNKLSKNNIDFAKFSIDAFFATRSTCFNSYSVDKEGEYFLREFGADPWKSYEDISIRVLESGIAYNEIIMVIADHILTPKDIKFEVNVKRKINDKFKRLAVAGVCRFDSKSNDLLQIADLIVGAISYDLKLSTNLILSGDKYKRRFLEYLKNNAGAKEFMNGFKSYNFNVFVDKDIRRRLPIIALDVVENEKRPSS